MGNILFKGQFNIEGSSLTFPAFNTDISVHHFRDILGDGHAKAGSLHMGSSGRIGALEGLEKPLQKLW